MMESLHRETAAERRVLCGITFVCYSSALASLVALAYSLSELALSTVAQQLAVLYSRAGM